MFLGTHTPKLDDKGRVILPAKFRDQLSDGLVLTRGQERCLYVFSTSQFGQIHQRIVQASLTSKDQRDFLRLFLSGAEETTADGQGRVMIPQTLREWAGLDRELTIIGAGTRAEIWDTAAWNQYYESVESGFADITEEVIPGLL